MITEDKSKEELTLELLELKHKIAQYEIQVKRNVLSSEKERRFRYIFNHLSDAIFVVNPYGFILDLNRNVENLLGFTREQLLQKSIGDITTPKNFNLFMKVISELNESSEKRLEIEYIRKDKSKVDVEIRMTIIDENKNPLILNVSSDITQRKKIEKGMRESEEKLKSILTSMVDLVFVLDVNLIFVDYYQPENSPGYCIRKDMIIGDSFKNVFPKRIVKSFEAAIETLITTKKPVQFDYYFTQREQFDYRLKKADYDTWYNAKISIRNNSNGDFDGITMVTRDITKIKRDQEAICNLIMENEHILNSIKSMIIGVNLENKITHWSKSAENNFGIKAHEIIDSNFDKLNINWDWGKINQTISTIPKDMKTIILHDMEYELSNVYRKKCQGK